uniref:Probable Fe(2+)-trafficking protein n=1 Tax=Candidatus Aschnera chinzeii TaxID=1485666 RepID=A0AAT9G3P4_9ENTR|nr:MAG: oxidative damage protection protein [Candidatus Aschnera chinzeii]
MNRKIFCSFLQCEAEGLDFYTYPGKIGEKIFNEISKEVWKKWIKKQTILINDYKLNTLNNKDKKFLEKEMINFLFKSNNLNDNHKR